MPQLRRRHRKLLQVLLQAKYPIKVVIKRKEIRKQQTILTTFLNLSIPPLVLIHLSFLNCTLTSHITLPVSVAPDSSSKKSIPDSKVFFISPNDPEIDSATKMKLKFGNGRNLVAKGLLNYSFPFINLLISLHHLSGPTKVRDPAWISDGVPREQNITPFTFGFGSLFNSNS